MVDAQPAMSGMPSAREMRSPQKPGLVGRNNYKVQSLVVEIEVQPKHKLEKYDRDVQCEIIDAQSAAKIQRVQDEDDYGYDDDAFEARMARAMARPSDFHTGLVAANRQDGLCSKCQAEKEAVIHEPVILSKAEAKHIIEEPHFVEFFDKTSRLIERALGQEFSLMQDFFKEAEPEADDDDAYAKGDKLTKKFTF